MNASLKSLPGVSIRGDETQDITRVMPEETPIALVFDGTSQAVMMCTPSDLEDFAKGFALTEGFVQSLDEIERFEIVEHDLGQEARFSLKGEPARALEDRRRKMIGPVGCGLCGIESLEEALRPLPAASSGAQLTTTDVLDAATSLRNHQPLHDQTNAMHAAGFFHPQEGLILAREDVGRHNALDKLIGALARSDIDPVEGAMILTSRVSIELVQKCAIAGCTVLVAVSAPTARAVHLAKEVGMTLVTFAKNDGFDVYAHPHRIKGER